MKCGSRRVGSNRRIFGGHSRHGGIIWPEKCVELALNGRTGATIRL